MDKEELARRSILIDGGTDCQAGKLEKQTTIRTLSEAELLCRKLAKETINQSSKIGEFKSSLEEDVKKASMTHRMKQ